MSTRANVIVVSPSMMIRQFYRHYDGYFEGTGTDLIEKAARAFCKCCDYKLNPYPDATEEKKLVERVESLNSAQGLPDWAQLPFIKPTRHFDWFMMEMAEDYRIEGNIKSWDENNYEPEIPFCLHGDIEWIYFVDFSHTSMSLYYSHLGIGSEIRDKYIKDFVSMYNYVKTNGYCALTLHEKFCR